MTADVLDRFRLVNHRRDRNLLLAEALSGPPMMTLTMDGASTLEVPISDADRKILRTELIEYRSWAEVDDIRFELVRLRKQGNRFTLEFEDSIAAALRRRRKPLSVPAGSTTRREFGIRLAREADVPYSIDPEKRPKVSRVLERSASGQDSDSWTVLGEMAEEIRWRRFSNTRRLILGSDDWLLARDDNPVRLREHRGGVHDIDFDLDVGKRASTATLKVDAKLWRLRPGDVARLDDDMGPARGRWLVREVRGPVTSTLTDVTLTRARHVLKEPKKHGDGDRGDPDYTPHTPGSRAGAKAANAARERMVRYALDQNGKAYVWGGNGPSGYDCSGLVQEASRAAGRALPKPSATQWERCRAAGKAIPISTALRTRGALLFRIGVADYNHVAISLGNGSTIEARGSGYGVGIFGGAASRGWTGAALWL